MSVSHNLMFSPYQRRYNRWKPAGFAFTLMLAALIWTHPGWAWAQEEEPAADSEPASQTAEPNQESADAATDAEATVQTGFEQAEAPEGESQEEGKPEEEKADASPAKKKKQRVKDHFTIGASVVLEADDKVKDMVVIFGSAEVNGTVTGDMVSIFSKVTLGPQADIRGDLVGVLSKLKADEETQVGNDLVVVLGELEAPPGFRVPHGEKVHIAPPAPAYWLVEWVYDGLFRLQLLPLQKAWAWVVVGAFLVLNLVGGALLSKPVEHCRTPLGNRPVTAFFVGLLVLFLLGPITFLLVAIVIGIPVVPFLYVLGFLGYFVGHLAIFQLTGMQMGAQVGWSWLERPLPGLLLGSLIFFALYAIPVVSLLVFGLLAPLSLGAACLGLASVLWRENENLAPPESEMPLFATGGEQPKSSDEGAGFGEATTSGLPVEAQPEIIGRAGFGPRFLATLIDLLLVLLLLIPLGIGKYFLPLWFAYHIALWSWKGTTIGGIILQLKIVRVDGRPVDFSVALVRSLSAALSAVALFIGFFWASWDRQRQAWHDKVAGTYIVRVRTGSQLL